MSFRSLMSIFRKVIASFMASVLLISLFPQYAVQNVYAAGNTVGSAIQATGGVGKYKEVIYWLNWGRESYDKIKNVPENSKIKNGDKSIFTTPSGTRYTVTISNIHKISGKHDFIHSTITEYADNVWPGGNNFPFAYNFDQGGKPVFSKDTAIAIRTPRQTTMGFRITVKAERPDPDNPGQYIKTASNIVLAGAESLAAPDGPKKESYSLTSPRVNADGEPTKINVLETYMSRRSELDSKYEKYVKDIAKKEGKTLKEVKDLIKAKSKDKTKDGIPWKKLSQWHVVNGWLGNEDSSFKRGQSDYNGFSLKATVTDVQLDGKPARKVEVVNPSGKNSKGDAMLVALNTNIVDVTMDSWGGTSIAIGVLDLLDAGDAPESYESGNLPAQHSAKPRLSDNSLANGEHYLMGPKAKVAFTDANGAYDSDIPHIMRPKLRVGSFVDYEGAPFYSSDAEGDDNHKGVISENGKITPVDDEDGIHTVIAGCSSLVDVTNEKAQPAYLHYWVDKNDNKKFDYTPHTIGNEYGNIDIPASYFDPASANDLVKKSKSIEVPIADLYSPDTKQTRLVRARISYKEELVHHGMNIEGEVEDTMVTFLNPRIQTGAHDLTCDDETSPFIFKDLPKTGRKITQTGTSSATYQGTSETKTINLPKGEYNFVIDSFDGIAPASCKKEFKTIKVEDTCKPAIELDKSTTTIGLVKDDIVTYTFKITNTGSGTLSNVNLTDALSGVYELANTNPDFDNTLAEGASTTFTAKYKVTQADVDRGTLINTGTVSANSQRSPLTDVDTVKLPQEPESKLVLKKTVASSGKKDDIKVGDTLTYTFTVTNKGNVTLSNVSVADAMTGLSTIAPATVATLAPGATTGFTATYTVAQKDVDAKKVENTAQAQGTQPGAKTPIKSNEDTAIVTGKSTPKLVLKKTVETTGEKANIKLGDKLTYTFAVTNTGNVTMNDVKVIDAMTGLSAIRPASHPSLAPGATATFTATYTVTQADVDVNKVENTAQAQGTVPGVKTPTKSNTDTAKLPAAQNPKLVFQKTVTSSGNEKNIKVGDVLSYTFAVTNTGNVTMNDVKVQGSMPGLSKIVPATVATLAPSATANFTATYTVTQKDVDKSFVTNTAYAEGTAPGAKTPTKTNTDTARFPAIQKSDLELIKTGKLVDDNHDGYDQTGEKVIYTFVVKNNGNVTLRDPVIKDEKLGFVGNNALVLNPTILNPGDSITITGEYILTYDDVKSTRVVNTATVSASDSVGGMVSDVSDSGHPADDEGKPNNADNDNDPTNDPTVLILRHQMSVPSIPHKKLPTTGPSDDELSEEEENWTSWLIMCLVDMAV